MSKKEKEKLYDQQINREVLIAAIKDRPVLWNKFLEIYKDKTAKTAAWREICIILKEDFEEMDQKDRQLFGSSVMKRWTQLRDTWRKSLDENKETKKSGSGTKSKPYKYNQEMSFLKPIIKPGETYDNNPNTRDEAQRENADQQENQKEKHLESSSKKKRMDSGSVLDDKMMKLVDHQLNTIGSDDRNMNFFKGVLPSLQHFDDDQILEFQSGVINLIQSIKTGRNYSNWHQNYYNSHHHNYNSGGYYTKPQESPGGTSNNNNTRPLPESSSIVNAEVSAETPTPLQPGTSLIHRDDPSASPALSTALSQLSDYVDLSNF
ncbi:hypothetical protein PYW08_006057 [Mythimna loreyi]|uniref:Uncharacterized protein n=1 Tax=Mythimna loreyi TaxID=667449 RepID=A0ACC2QP45_9NEOP|nr:hypothetical protein PYW08_006057 [Mythimna loreyi]